jgi:hypothetical protein
MKWNVWKWWIFAWATPPASGGVEVEGIPWRPLIGRLLIRNSTRLHARLEFKLADLWVGAYFQSSWEYPSDLISANHARIMLNMGVAEPADLGMTRRIDIWVCLAPCLPIHLTWWGRRPDPKPYHHELPIHAHAS